MCGRYLIEGDDRDMHEIIALAEKGIRDGPAAFKGGEISPSDTAPVIAGHGACFMVWGYPALHAGSKPHINARSETAAALKTFGEAVETRRCIVPASGYYEWKTAGKKRKEKYVFTLPDRMPLYMAGIHSGDGQYAILTREAAPAINDIHGRMPAIIPQALIAVWLSGTPDVLEEALTDLCFEFVLVSAGQAEQLCLFT